MSTAEIPTFDPDKFKATTREQWQEAAAAWDRWGPTLESWLGPATEAMLDAAGVSPGARVLDVAAGAGGQTLAAARRVVKLHRALHQRNTTLRRDRERARIAARTDPLTEAFNRLARNGNLHQLHLRRPECQCDDRRQARNHKSSSQGQRNTHI